MGDHVSPPPVRLSVSDLPPQALQATRQSLVVIMASRYSIIEKNQFQANDNQFSRKNDFNILRPVVSAYAAWHQVVPICTE